MQARDFGRDDESVPPQVREARATWARARDEAKNAMRAILACIETDPGQVRAWLASVLGVATPEQKGCSVAGLEGKGGRCVGPIEKRRARWEARMRRIAAVREEALARIRAAVEGALGDDSREEPERLRAAVEAFFRAVEEWPLILAEIIAEDTGECADWIGEVTMALAGMLSCWISPRANGRLATALRAEGATDLLGLLAAQLPGAVFEAIKGGSAIGSLDALRNRVSNLIAGPERKAERRERERLRAAARRARESPSRLGMPPEADFVRRIHAADDLDRRIAAAKLRPIDGEILYRSKVAGYASVEIADRLGVTSNNVRIRAMRSLAALRAAEPDEDDAA